MLRKKNVNVKAHEIHNVRNEDVKRISIEQEFTFKKNKKEVNFTLNQKAKLFRQFILPFVAMLRENG